MNLLLGVLLMLVEACGHSYTFRLWLFGQLGHAVPEGTSLVASELTVWFSCYRNFLFIFAGEGPVVKALILTCVEGMNVSLLVQAIQEQRKYFSERQERMEDSTS